MVAIQNKISSMFLFIVVLFAISVSWQLFEIIEFGALQPSVSDTIVGFVLAYLITDKIERKGG